MRIIFWLISVPLLIFSNSPAQHRASARSAHVEARLISESRAIVPGRSFWLGVLLKMDPHWHTYWKNPGDSGMETSVSWSVPPGLHAGSLRWPYPQKISMPPLASYGYEGEVLLLTKFDAAPDLKPGQTVTIAAEVEWLECEEICLPGEAELQISMPVAETPPAPDAKMLQRFARARADLPLAKSEWNLAATADSGEFRIEAIPPGWFTGEITRLEFFPYEADLIPHAAEQSMQKRAGAYVLHVPRADSEAAPPARIRGVLMATPGWRGPDSERALELDLEIEHSSPTVPPGPLKSGVSTIWVAVAFAFIGGIILNLMPCVLPVLSLKIMSLANQAGAGAKQVRAHAGLYTLGVLAAFWVLAGMMLLLKWGGQQVGWGFQLQSPEFLIILSAILSLFALNLFGVYEIGGMVQIAGGRIGRDQPGSTGAFLSGVAATVLATPCTAPFMGSALGYTLSQPAHIGLVVFTFLGLGMAAPFAILSGAPALHRFLPRPGAWMVTLKQFMGFLLLGTVLWLLWVLGNQRGLILVLQTLGGILLMAFGAWVIGRWADPTAARHRRILVRLIGVVIIIAPLYFLITWVGAAGPAAKRSAGAAQSSGIAWQDYTRDRLQAARRAGKPVFIDFTAAWCLSCQVNEKVAFSSPEVQSAFRDLEIVALKADWTARDATITRALAEYGRNSVPLYVLYGRDHSAEPAILPEILTPGIVLQALEKVRRPERNN